MGDHSNYTELRKDWGRVRRARQAIRLAWAVVGLEIAELRRRVRRRLRF